MRSGRAPTAARALRIAALVLCAAAWTTAAPLAAVAEESPVVAAAASAQFALGEIARSFHHQSGHRVRLSYGSSGNLARQIRQGAPYQLFLSADERYALDLARDGLTEGRGVLYGIGRLALVVPRGSALEADGSLEDLRRALADGRLGKFAIANPEHAPYGQRAEEALRSADLWDAIRGHLVFGENVAQAAQFATSQNAQGGIIAYSLIRSGKLSGLASFELIAQSRHRPLRQRMVLVKGAGAVARQFYEFLQQPPSRAVFRRYGFVVPGEAD